MNARPRPSTLEECCALNRSGRMLVHRWAPSEHLRVQSAATGESLRIILVRCLRCSAWRINSRGGDADILDELLEHAWPIPEISWWVSHEQPGYEVLADLLPQRKRSDSGRRAA